MIYIFREASSQSARLLAEAVDGVRLRTPERLLRRARTTDKVVMWGAYLPNVQGMVINNVPIQSKYEDALRLKEAGVRTVEVARTRPAPVAQQAPVDPLIAMWEEAQDAAEAFTQVDVTRNQVALAGVYELREKLTQLMGRAATPAPAAPPPVEQGIWLGRTYNHSGGADLLNPGRADFYSKKEAFVKEYRVHSFLGRSIRAGAKILREGYDIAGVADVIGDIPGRTPLAHRWVRSYDAGWMISYEDGMGIKQKHRDVAHAAVRALGLSFGAVDIGELADGTLVVIEVNRASGAEGGTVEAYSRAIRRWTSGEWTATNVNAGE